jgi:hypothetical protein
VGTKAASRAAWEYNALGQHCPKMILTSWTFRVVGEVLSIVMLVALLSLTRTLESGFLFVRCSLFSPTARRAPSNNIVRLRRLTDPETRECFLSSFHFHPKNRQLNSSRETATYQGTAFDRSKESLINLNQCVEFT